MSRHPTPQWCVQEKQGQHSRDESFSQIAVRVHSSPSAKLASGERLSLPCIGVDGMELERAHAARLLRKHMRESCVFLTAKNMEKGRWQLSGGWLMVKCSLFLASSPRSYFRTYCRRLVWEREKKNNNKWTACSYPANTVFPNVMLRCHEGTLFVFLSL